MLGSWSDDFYNILSSKQNSLFQTKILNFILIAAMRVQINGCHLSVFTLCGLKYRIYSRSSFFKKLNMEMGAQIEEPAFLCADK